MTNIKITYDDQSYTVTFIGRYGESEIAYGDKHTSMEDHAQNFYELAACLNASVEMEEV